MDESGIMEGCGVNRLVVGSSERRSIYAALWVPGGDPRGRASLLILA